jgi:hypothetical protein
MYDSKQINEQALLAAIGVHASDYKLTEAIAKRALEAVRHGKMGEAALLNILLGDK